MNVVDAIGIALELKTEKLDDGLKRAQNSVSTFAIAIGSALGNIFSGVVESILQNIPRVFGIMKAEVKALDDINKKTNANVEDVAAWGAAIEESGGSAKAFQGTLMHLYNDLSRISITGRGRSKPFLEALGIDPATLSGKEVFEVINDITKAVQGMDTQKSSYILKNLGFDPDTIKFIQSEGKNIDEVIAKQKEWGVYTAKDTEAIDKMDKAIKRATNSLKSLFIPIFSKVLTAISKGAEYISKAIIYFRKNTNMLRTAILLLTPAIINFAKVLLSTPIGKIVAGLASLIILFEDLWVYAKGGKTAFGDIWKNLGTPEEVMKGFESAGRTIERFFKFFGGLFDEKNGSKTLKFIVMIVGAVGALAAVIGAIPTAIAVAIALLIRYWEDIEKFFSDLKNRIEEYFGGEFEKNMSDLWDGLKIIFSNFISWVKEKWQGLKDWLSDIFTFDIKTPKISDIFGESKDGESAWDSLSNTVFSVIDAIKEKWQGFVEFIESGWAKIKSVFADNIKIPDFNLPKMPKFNLPQLPNFKIPDISKIWGRIAGEIADIWNKVSGVITEKIDFIKGKLEEVGKFLSGIWNGIKNSVNEIIGEITNIISNVLSEIESVVSAISSFIGTLADAIWEQISLALNSVIEVFEEVFDYIRSTISSVVDTVRNAVQYIADSIVDAIQGAFQLLVSVVISLWGGLIGLIQSGINTIADTWNGNVSLMEAALEAIAGLWNGFIALIQTSLNAIAELWNGVVSALETGSISIGSFLANAANTARRAWESFITWLEQKWQWLKDLLPSFANIANKLPSIGNSVQMAMAGGGGVSTTTTTDNSVNNYTFNATTTQAADRFIEKSGYSSQMNTGVRR